MYLSVCTAVGKNDVKPHAQIMLKFSPQLDIWLWNIPLVFEFDPQKTPFFSFKSRAQPLMSEMCHGSCT